MKRTLLLFCLALPLAAQTVVNGSWDFSGLLGMPSCTFASPPAAPAAGKVCVFTDALTPGAVVGGGSSLTLARYSGAAWVALGAATNGITSDAVIGDNALVNGSGGARGVKAGGAATHAGSLAVTGNADAVQLDVKGNATQTNPVMRVRKSDDTVFFQINNDGSVQIGAGGGAWTPATAAGSDLGSATLPFKDFFFAGTSGTPGTNNFKLTGASTSGTRVITAPDGDSTIPLNTLLTALKIRPCEIHIWGTGAASALQDTDDEVASCRNKYGATLTVTAVECYADNGSTTTTVTPIVTGGAADSILSGALTCGNATFAAGTLNGTPTLASNGTIDANVTAAGTAKSIRLVITFTL